MAHVHVMEMDDVDEPVSEVSPGTLKPFKHTQTLFLLCILDGDNKPQDLTVNDIVIIDPETTVLDLNHGRIGRISNLEPLVNIEQLYLRWNLIKKIENLDMLTTLRELELYDNQITKIENLSPLVNLE